MQKWFRQNFEKTTDFFDAYMQKNNFGLAELIVIIYVFTLVSKGVYHS